MGLCELTTELALSFNEAYDLHLYTRMHTSMRSLAGFRGILFPKVFIICYKRIIQLVSE